MITRKVKVGILGCTGLVGQRLIERLDQHPNFKIEKIYGRPQRSGQLYYDAVNWCCDSSLPKRVAEMRISSIDDEKEYKGIELFFSALPTAAAQITESKLRSMGFGVVSNAKNHRMDKDVPLLVPEININSLELVKEQKQKYSGGFIATNPNCCVIGITLALAPIETSFGIEELHIVTLQARSGAGIKGLTSTEITANVIPNIQDEEEKIRQEIPKIFGKHIPVKVRVNRVPVADGHTFNIWVTTKKSFTVDALKRTWTGFKPECGYLHSLSNAGSIYQIYDDDFMPQPKVDASFLNGMGTSIGRIESISGNEFCFTAVSNNIIRGAAGGTILVAEALSERGII